MQDRRDPLDIGNAPEKSWEEFRASFAGAFLQVWLLEELSQIAPDYIDELESRFYTGFLNAEGLAEDDPEYDGAVPIQDADSKGVTFYDPGHAETLYRRLFPHWPTEPDHRSQAYGLALVGLHASLDAYARALGLSERQSSLPMRVRRFVKAKTKRDLDADIADSLTEADATRHVVVHNRGIVDDGYADAVKENKLRRGEFRPLTSGVVHAFAHAIWVAAERLREAAATAS